MTPDFIDYINELVQKKVEAMRKPIPKNRKEQQLTIYKLVSEFMDEVCLRNDLAEVKICENSIGKKDVIVKEDLDTIQGGKK